ncbi:MAG: PD-(D/E)XK nuclease family protein [Patescibacteria group bacterium]
MIDAERLAACKQVRNLTALGARHDAGLIRIYSGHMPNVDSILIENRLLAELHFEVPAFSQVANSVIERATEGVVKQRIISIPNPISAIACGTGKASFGRTFSADGSLLMQLDVPGDLVLDNTAIVLGAAVTLRRMSISVSWHEPTMTSTTSTELRQHRPTASRLHIAVHCVWAFWSPDAVWPADDSEASEEASMGRLFHAYAADRANSMARRPDQIAKDMSISLKESMKTVRNWIAAWEREMAPFLSQPILSVENPVIYDPRTHSARLHPGKDPRKVFEFLEPGEWSGAADLVLGDSCPTVIDWKTGQVEGTEAIEHNMQMRFLGTAVAAWIGAQTIRIMLAFVDEDMVRAETAVLGPADFLEVRATLADIQRAMDEKLAPNPGAWCRYCPARAFCPETRESIEQVDPSLNPEMDYPVVALPELIQDERHAAWMLSRLQRVRMAVDDVQRALQTWADANGGIRTDTGVWGRHEVPVERIRLNADGLVRMFEFPEAVRPSTSKEAIKDAARARGLSVADTLERVMTSLREVGATETITQVRYEERRRKQ